MPDWSTVLRWAGDDSHPFCQQYARAREIQADTWADEIIEVADEAIDHESAAAAKVRVDARKWVASKLKPKRYGESVGDAGSKPPQEPDPVYPAMTPEQARAELFRISGGKASADGPERTGSD